MVIPTPGQTHLLIDASHPAPRPRAGLTAFSGASLRIPRMQRGVHDSRPWRKLCLKAAFHQTALFLHQVTAVTAQTVLPNERFSLIPSAVFPRIHPRKAQRREPHTMNENTPLLVREWRIEPMTSDARRRWNGTGSTPVSLVESWKFVNRNPSRIMASKSL